MYWLRDRQTAAKPRHFSKTLSQEAGREAPRTSILQGPRRKGWPQKDLFLRGDITVVESLGPKDLSRRWLRALPHLSTSAQVFVPLLTQGVTFFDRKATASPTNELVILFPFKHSHTMVVWNVWRRKPAVWNVHNGSLLTGGPPTLVYNRPRRK